jgi:lipoate-protein ligase B
MYRPTSTSTKKFFWQINLNRCHYEDVNRLQRQILVHRKTGKLLEDGLIFAEFYPVITLGRNGSIEDILVSSEELKKRGIEYYKVDRGGAVTFHGPGQLVVYPIVHLRFFNCDIKLYIGFLEKLIIEVLREFGVEANSDRLGHGVWIEDKKVASIGIGISHWITYHGFSLNISNSAGFDLICPCGRNNIKVGCLSDFVSPVPSVKDTIRLVTEKFQKLLS